MKPFVYADNAATTKIDDASDYYGGDSSYFASDNGVELGSWIYDHTNQHPEVPYRRGPD